MLYLCKSGLCTSSVFKLIKELRSWIHCKRQLSISQLLDHLAETTWYQYILHITLIGDLGYIEQCSCCNIWVFFFFSAKCLYYQYNSRLQLIHTLLVSIENAFFSRSFSRSFSPIRMTNSISRTHILLSLQWFVIITSQILSSCSLCRLPSDVLQCPCDSDATKEFGAQKQGTLNALPWPCSYIKILFSINLFLLHIWHILY